ncbi:MAG: hypothetical protein ACLFRE_05905, partial [Desulfovermiculus sp.]
MSQAASLIAHFGNTSGTLSPASAKGRGQGSSNSQVQFARHLAGATGHSPARENKIQSELVPEESGWTGQSLSMVDSDQQDEHLTQILELLFQESSAQPEELQKMMYEEGFISAFLSQLVGAIQHIDLDSQPNQGQAHAAEQVQGQGTAQGQGLNREASSEL